MKLPWGSIAILSCIAFVCALVATFNIPTIGKVGLRLWPKKPLSPDEIVKLGAVAAGISICNEPVERTQKAYSLAYRLKRDPDDPAEQEALRKAEESFGTTGCRELLSEFPDVLYRVDL